MCNFLANKAFLDSSDKLARLINNLHRKQGFWDKAPSMKELAIKIAHAHSELSEAYECARLGGKKPDKNILDYTGLEVQLADVMGILLDLQAAYNLRITEALLHKMDFNKTREYLHGKEF